MKNCKTLITFLLLTGLGIIISLLIDEPGESKTVCRRGGVPGRIICMSPAVTELVFALGCDERVVGVSDFCVYPAATEKKQKVGGEFNPNFERLTALRPDLIITQGRSAKIADFCQRKQIPIFQLKVNTVEQILADARLLGRRLGRTEQAENLCRGIQDNLRAIEQKVGGGKKRRVFFSLGRVMGSLSGLTTVSGNTFISELIDKAGGVNIFADLEQNYPRISKESLLKREPEIIIEAHPGQELTPQKKEKFLQDWQQLGTLGAVQNGRICFLTADYLIIPAARIDQIALRLAQVIHPEVFGE